jgi:hypothetical protein
MSSCAIICKEMQQISCVVTLLIFNILITQYFYKLKDKDFLSRIPQSQCDKISQTMQSISDGNETVKHLIFLLYCLFKKIKYFTCLG